MSDPPLSEGFVSLLTSLEDWLTGEHVPHALIGGVAVSLIAQPRFTNDVDAVIWADRPQWESLVRAGAAQGFHPRINDVIEFAERSRVLLLTHTPTAINVDISFGALPFEKETIDRAHTLQLRGAPLRVSTPEDFADVLEAPELLADLNRILGTK